MRKILAFLLTAAFLSATPALAAGESLCEHEFEVTVLRPATCAEKGLAAYSCGKCGYAYTSELLPDGAHEYVLTDTTATCTVDGEATYACERCGDTYTAPDPAPGHVPEDAPATCTHSQVCLNCGQILVHATGHAYAYQYDAQRDGDGAFTAYGAWKCANCGKILPATEGNAEYYYSLPEAEQASAMAALDLAPASATDPDPMDPATATDADPVDPATDTDADPMDPATDTDAPEAARGSSDGLWLAISAAVLTAIAAEAVILFLSLRKKSHER